jgi:hypothetical protein
MYCQEALPRAGSYFLATYLAGTLFDREARKFKHGACKGPACFRLAFLVIAGFALLALILSVVLHRRTKHLYHRVVEDTKAERKRRGREVRPPPPLSHTHAKSLIIRYTLLGFAVCMG